MCKIQVVGTNVAWIARKQVNNNVMWIEFVIKFEEFLLFMFILSGELCGNIIVM